MGLRSGIGAETRGMKTTLTILGERSPLQSQKACAAHLAWRKFVGHNERGRPWRAAQVREETPKEGIATVVAGSVYMGRELPHLHLVNSLPAIMSGKPCLNDIALGCVGAAVQGARGRRALAGARWRNVGSARRWSALSK